MTFGVPRLLAGELVRAARSGLTRHPGLPAHSTDLDPSLLAPLSGREVRSVALGASTSGTTDRSTYAVTWGPGVQGPASVFVKTGATGLATRLFGGLARLGEVEVGFYRDLRPGLAIEAPEPVAAEFDRPTGRFVIVLADLAAHGAEFVDTLTPLTPERVSQTLSTLAALHGATAGTRGGHRWLIANSQDRSLPLIGAALPRLARRCDRLHPGLLTRSDHALLGSYPRWVEELDRGPRSVLHGDTHPGNVYLLPDRVGLLDWQAVRSGHPVRDVTDHLVTSMDVEDRRACERDLLAGYARDLAAAGGPVLSQAAVWLAHRRMAAYVLVATAFTSGFGGLQGEAVADAGLVRASTAVADLETSAALA